MIATGLLESQPGRPDSARLGRTRIVNVNPSGGRAE